MLETQELIDGAAKALDPAGMRFLLCALSAQHERGEAAPHVTSTDVAWAVQSDCHATLLDMCLSRAGKDWAALRALGVGFWMPAGDELRAAIEAALA